jgi:hypothetical protein
MPRKHTFLIVVLLGAVVMAGLLAVSRTVVLADPSQASTGSDPTIAYRLKRLDRFEAALRGRAAELKATPTPSTTTVYRQAPVTRLGSTKFGDEDHGQGGDDESGDDAFDD